MEKNRIKALVLKHERVLSRLYRLLGRNVIRVARGSTFNVGNAFMKRCTVSVSGKDNTVEIQPGLTRLENCSVSIHGSGCRIVIGAGSNLKCANLCVQDDNGRILIGNHVTVSGTTEMAAIEGTSIEIGDDCLFSAQIQLRTGDSHSILDKASGKRINPSKDIHIGEHVWIGPDVKLLKGVRVGSHSIVGTGAVLSEGEYPSNCIVGGLGHGRVLKEGIDWTPERLPLE